MLEAEFEAKEFHRPNAPRLEGLGAFFHLQYHFLNRTASTRFERNTTSTQRTGPMQGHRILSAAFDCPIARGLFWGSSYTTGLLVRPERRVVVLKILQGNTYQG